MTNDVSYPPLSRAEIVRTWWPLAASWLLLASELPLVNAFVARGADPEIHLAAFGGVVFSIALIIEAPIIMLLAASTALSKDGASYRLVYRYMMISGGVLTVLHILIAFTPLYYGVVVGLLGAPAEIVEPARAGLQVLTPWTWSIAYRRFNQGLLIRFGHSRAIGGGTVVRLVADCSVLGVCSLLGTVPGTTMAALAIAAGVVSGAIYSGIFAHPVIEQELPLAAAVEPPLTYGAFYRFYMPLVLTSLIGLLAQPIGTAALSRMPDALTSLAVWPVVSGLVFMTRGLGIAYNEVVVALLDRPKSIQRLRSFAVVLAVATTVSLLLLTTTPLGRYWFEGVAALSPRLAGLARNGLWLALPLPALSVAQSWYQGVILHGRRTRGITEAVVLYLGFDILILAAGMVWGSVAGLYVGLGAFVIASLVQTLWLWWRARPLVQRLSEGELPWSGR